MNKLNHAVYRPDIDGLRAIAVIAVLFFHINKDLVPGGYAGVDIFFVISGYLITFLIYGRITRRDFSFAEFYRRRINRIAPALFVLVAFVSAVGMVILAPHDLLSLLKSGMYAGIGVSNVFFWHEYGNYFSSGVNEAPLLHTWSLGVEEQFYVIWPVMLLLFTRLKPKVVVVVMLLVLIATVGISELGVRNAASASYYLLPTRFFELLIGSALAILIFNRGALFSRIISVVAGLAGLALTLGSLFFLAPANPFPGFNALYPCVGAALLIASGASPDTWTSRLLSFRPLVSIGLMSYSLYLWHWPIIAFVNYLSIRIDFFVGALIAVGSVAMGWLSWRFVEMPFRHSGSKSSVVSVAGWRFAVPLLTISLVYIAVERTGGLPGRFDSRIVEYEKIIASAPNELRSGCHSPTILYYRHPDPVCLLGVTTKAPEALLVGDSFANHFTGMVDVLARSDNVSVTDYTMDGCLPVKGMGFGAVAAYAEKCRKRNQFTYEYIASNSYRYVILAASWPDEGTVESFADLEKGLKNSINAILSSGAMPIIILNNHSTGNANCPIRRSMSGSTESCDVLRLSNNMQRLMFFSLKKMFSQITFIDPNEAICQKLSCRSMINGIPLYRDSKHLNDMGSRMIGKILLEKGIHLIPLSKSR